MTVVRDDAQGGRSSRPRAGAGAGRPWRRLAGSGEVLVVAVVAGFVVSGLQVNLQYLATTMAVYVLFALSVNILVGWNGTPSFGQAAYFGGGAYFVAVLRDVGWNPVGLLVLAGLFGAVLALFFGLVAARTRGISFAMLTLVFGQVLYQLTFTIDALEGENGIPGVPAGTLFGVDLASPGVFWWYCLGVVAGCAIVLRRLYGSSFGRSVIAARDDPVRAAALGVPVRRLRIASFTVAGFFGAVAGALSAQQQGIVSPNDLFWVTSGNVLIMCLIGGTSYFWGPAVGAVVFTWLSTQLFQGTPHSNLYIGLILLAVVLVFKGGLTGLPSQGAALWHRLRASGRMGAPGRTGRTGGAVP